MTITQRGLCVAWDDPMLAETPTWTSLYDYETVAGKRALRFQEVTIDRGRQSELDKTMPGTLVATVKDFAGILDATNTSSPFNGKIKTLRQAAFFLTNPETNVEHTLFRGLIESIESDLDPSKKYITHTITVVDLEDVLAAAQVIPDSTGNSPFVATGVQTRILAALADADIPAGLVNIFTGNVNVRAKNYGAGTTILEVIQEAADAEFPGVANFYADKDGILTFHGRDARFHPEVSDYDISHWYAGDGAAVDADGLSRVAPICSLKWRLSKDDIINTALAYPEGIPPQAMPGQLVSDSTSVDDVGVRAEEFPNLQTGDDNPDGNDANAETAIFAGYYESTYKDQAVRIEEVGFQTRRAGSKNFAQWWALLVGVDISDIITVLTSHPGGGGFDYDGFVEQLHYDIHPRKTSFPQIEMQAELSPRSYYTTDPFSD